MMINHYHDVQIKTFIFLCFALCAYVREVPTRGLDWRRKKKTIWKKMMSMMMIQRGE